MSTTSKVAIDIVTAYKGANDVKKAQDSLGTLDSAVAKLGKTLAVTFSATAIAAFGKSAFEAFTKDEAAATTLAQTLKNVGQGFADAGIEKFITNTSLATGIMKNDLRSAFDSIIRQTHSAAAAQDILNTAINVSAGSGKDLATVAASLSKAYGGQTQAIGRLNVGLTKADLTGKSFAEIQAKLNQLFAGQASVAADTYAGKIKRLSASFEEAKVTIGKGFVDAFSSLSSNGSLDNFVTSMQESAQYVADMVSGFGSLLGYFNKFNSGKSVNWISDILALSPLKLLANIGKAKRTAAEDLANEAASSISTRGAGRQANIDTSAARAKAKADAAAALAAQQKLNKAAADKLAIDKASALLKQSQRVFDLQAIEIQAALQNDKLDQNDKLRLQIMATQDQLSAAIENGNTPAINSLTASLTSLLDTFTKIQAMSPFDKAIASVDAFVTGLSKAMDVAYQLSLLTQGISLANLYTQADTANTAGNYALGAVYDSQAAAADAAAQAAAIDALNTADQSSQDAIDAAMAAAQAATDAANAANAIATAGIHLYLDGQQITSSIVNNSANGTASSYIKSGWRDNVDW